MRILDKSSLDQTDDILISDDMDDMKSDTKSYEFDGFMDIDMAPKPEVSLFERKLRDKDPEEDTKSTADESWAEMLIEDEEDDTPQLAVIKPKTEEQLADDELASSIAIQNERPTGAPSATNPRTNPGLVFSLVDEPEEIPQNKQSDDDLVLSDELANIPNHQGFSASASNVSDMPDPRLFAEPDETPSPKEEEASKRQVKTQPKIRAYDNSRSALLMNIMPAPIEFTAKRMRRWYQSKLWPTLSCLALIALIVQVGWFKFDYFSRVEPYRTGYVFLCPYIGCQVPTLVDTSRIITSNLSVRTNKEVADALEVDVLIINNAPFEQPFPDLELVFTDINENNVAARRFKPEEYLGGEMAGQQLMPQNQKVYISLDLVDPGAEAVNYYIQIIGNQQ
ncbi:DUF3426 domain-containing protein [Cellvibrio sp. pealriver]|uniref:DUF3426 domain-containing protein n=1 Tax=Cellvibrio sp. pealriver TaxID=1622269 RepID=UPI001E315039|nr:DUF3426 domain-containing protein [Cellvibrio sp. pealriver]